MSGNENVQCKCCLKFWSFTYNDASLFAGILYNVSLLVMQYDVHGHRKMYGSLWHVFAISIYS